MARDRLAEAAALVESPYSHEAEQGVLGAIIMADLGRAADAESPGFEAAIRAGLTAEDFSVPAHQTIFATMGQLAQQRTPISIASLLPFLPDEEIAPDWPPKRYLARLAREALPAQTLPDHAALVRDLAVRRAIVRATRQAADAAANAAPDQTPEMLLADTVAALQKVADAGVRHPSRSPIGEAVARLLTDARAIKDGVKKPDGVPTGLTDLDRQTGGLQPGMLWVIGARPGMGKVHPLDLLVDTPVGRRRWGDLAPGDCLFGRDGAPTRIKEIFPNPPLQMYLVSFDDGSSTEVGADHLWNVRSRAQRQRGDVSWQTLSTRELIASRVKRPDGGRERRVWEIPDHGAAQFEARPTDLDPYFVGVWLGDGKRGEPSYSKESPEIAARIAGAGYRVIPRADGLTKYVTGIVAKFKDAVFSCKSPDRYIPAAYKYNSIRVRRAVFDGLCDTDGEVYNAGTIGFSTTSRRLAEDMLWLARSLGCKASIQPAAKQGRYRGRDGVMIECRLCWRLTINAPFNPFSHAAKRARFKPSAARYRTRWIDSIEPTRVVAGMCVRVAAADCLYLANDFIVTHNTALMVTITNNVGRASVKRERADLTGWGVLEFSLEVPEPQLVARHVAEISYIPRSPIQFGRIMAGDIDDEEIWRLQDAQKRLDEMPIIIDTSSRVSVAEIQLRVRAEKARFARQGVELKVVLIDYLKFIKAGDRYRGNRVYEIGEITAQLKQIAKQEGVCIVLFAQLNRALENRDDKRPTLSDLRESGDLEADADVVLFLHRESYFIAQSPKYRAGDEEAVASFEDARLSGELIVGKNRHGATRLVPLFVDIGASAFSNASDRFS